ncbi:hypothetical protein AAK913_12525 [Enterococcus faecium]|uniref:hypothetical protein n=1 Tax=Enterococcus faecium TaxID=1352 RepID=UPI003516E7A3
MKKNNLLYFGNTIIILLMILTIITTISFIRLKTHGENNSKISQEVSSLKEDIKNYNDLKIDYTLEDAKNEIVEDEIDLKGITDDLKGSIVNGVTTVYDETKTSEDYDKLKEKIPSAVGKDFADKLLSLAKPSLSQTGKLLTPFGGLINVTVDFGEYDILDHTIDCLVIVEYKSPEMDASHTGAEDKKTEVSILHGFDAFSLSFNTKDKDVKLLDYQNTIKNEVQNNE